MDIINQLSKMSISNGDKFIIIEEESKNNGSLWNFEISENQDESSPRFVEFKDHSKFARKPTDSEISANLPPNKRCILSSKAWCIVISVVSAVLMIGGLTAALTIAHI